MQKSPEIKRFVQKTLGCSCPEDVFRKIDCTNAADGVWDRKINVGDRLLIYILDMNRHQKIPEVIESAMQRGVGERNNQGFNRFRLVLVTSKRDELSVSAERAFTSSEFADEMTHLHIVNHEDIKGL